MFRFEALESADALLETAADPADVTEQQQLAAPDGETDASGPAGPWPTEVDAGDLAEQRQVVALDDELRDEPFAWAQQLSSWRSPAFEEGC